MIKNRLFLYKFAIAIVGLAGITSFQQTQCAEEPMVMCAAPQHTYRRIRHKDILVEAAPCTCFQDTYMISFGPAVPNITIPGEEKCVRLPIRETVIMIYSISTDEVTFLNEFTANEIARLQKIIIDGNGKLGYELED